MTFQKKMQAWVDLCERSRCFHGAFSMRVKETADPSRKCCSELNGASSSAMLLERLIIMKCLSALHQTVCYLFIGNDFIYFPGLFYSKKWIHPLVLKIFTRLVYLQFKSWKLVTLTAVNKKGRFRVTFPQTHHSNIIHRFNLGAIGWAYESICGGKRI